MRMLITAVALSLTLGSGAAADEAGGLLDLREELQVSAQKRLFFEAPAEDSRYIARDVEFWGTGFDDGGLTESYPAEEWAAFDLAALEAGRTRAVALLALNDSSRELLAFLEEGDLLTLTVTLKDRIEYMWTDVILDKEESREMVLFEVETLSYSIPRVEGYSVLWYDRRDPTRIVERTHLSQDVLSRMSTRVEPGQSLEIDLAPGGIQTFFFPEMDGRILPVTLETKYAGALVFGVLSGRMGLSRKEAGSQIPGSEEGDSVVELSLPGDLAGHQLYLVRKQSSITYFLLHVPQEQPSGMKAKLVVGQPPAPEPPVDTPPGE